MCQFDQNLDSRKVIKIKENFFKPKTKGYLVELQLFAVISLSSLGKKWQTFWIQKSQERIREPLIPGSELQGTSK